MNQRQFETLHEPDWAALERWFEKQQRGDTPTDASADFDFTTACRRISRHLALARARGYGPTLVARLEGLARRAHQALYGARPPLWRRITQFAGAEFPALVRAEWRLVALACALLYGSFAAMAVAVRLDPELVYSVADRTSVEQIERMYDPASTERLGRERDATTDIQMFGFYIRNNTSIGFQTFAGGLLFGLATLLALAFNGVFLGSIAGHMTQIGHGTPFWSFIAGHSAPELTAIALSAAAGFKLAAALIHPGRKSRRHALRDNAAIAVQLVYGAAALFVLAAYIEAFWSSRADVPSEWKYIVGGGGWALLLAYFALAGRVRHGN